MTNFLIKTFIKNHENISDNSVREKYGIISSSIGVFCNIILFVLKFTIGLLSNSIAITADSFNNLSDAGSNIISFIGFKFANKPPDAEHPFGHGRFEYISGLIVSFVIMLIGYEFLKSSVEKIFSPDELVFSYISVILLTLSVLIKIWLGFFYKKISIKINSKTLKATSVDSFNDVYVTSLTIFSIIVYKYTGLAIDGYVGVFVAIILLYGGYNLAKDTLSPLLGESTSVDVSSSIKKFVESFDGIVGSHDLIVHDYGPNRRMATIHAEVPTDIDIETSHQIIDNIERESLKQLNLFLLIHMDPVSIDDEAVSKIRTIVNETLINLNLNFDTHDFRLVKTDNYTNVIFELEVPHNSNTQQLKSLISDIKKNIRQLDETYNVIINVENGYTCLK